METGHQWATDEATDEMSDPAGPDAPTGGNDDDVIILPWWQHPLNIVTMLVATALIAGMLGWLIHDESSGADANDVDIGFLQDMRVHHDQAVQMSYIFLDRPDTDGRLRTVARSIVLGQGIDIGRMIQQLRHLGAPEIADTDMTMGWMGMAVPIDEMPGLASDAELARLAGAEGAAADDLFVELMSAHHRGGLGMAETAATEAGTEAVRSMAASILDSQRDEIVELERLTG